MEAFLILNLRNKFEVGGQLHVLAALLHCKESQKTLNRRLGAPPGRTSSFGVKKCDYPLVEIEPRFPGGPARSPVTKLTELHRYHRQ